MTRRNPCLDAALRELDAAGIRDVERAYGGKHLQLRWQANGHGTRMYSVPLTTSDWRSPRNTAADIRRLLKEDGMLTAAPPKPPLPSPKPPDRISQLEARVAALESALREILSSSK
jgi:hypothetical protein